MALIPLLAMVRKDLQLFFSDRRSVIVSFVVPIAIASFFGMVFSGGGADSEPARINVAIVDEDMSAISKAILAGAQADRSLAVTTPSLTTAQAEAAWSWTGERWPFFQHMTQTLYHAPARNRLR